MIGLLQSIGHGLENFGLAVEGAFLEAECAVKNTVTDIKTDAKVRKYQKERMATGYTLDEEDIEKIEEDEKEMKFYEEMFEKLAQHEEAGKRNPVDIAIDLGYSEEEVNEAFEYLQQKMKVEEEKAQVGQINEEIKNTDAETEFKMIIQNYLNSTKGTPNKTSWSRAILEYCVLGEDDDETEED